MSKNNDVVIIELDRPRELRFGHKALKKMEQLGVDIAANGQKDFSFEDVEKIIYCGLLSDAKENNEKLELADMEDLLDKAPSYQHIIERMTKAFNIAFGANNEGGVSEGN